MPKGQSDPRVRLAKIQNRWGHVPADAFTRFQKRVVLLLDPILEEGGLYEDGTDATFALIHGHDSEVGPRLFLKRAESLPEFMVVLQELFLALEQRSSKHTDMVLGLVEEAKRHSPGVDFRVSKRDGFVTFYPAGAKELDVSLVEEPLEWLSSFPKVSQHFGEALRIVLTRDENKYRNALDNLRWSLEQLLRTLLNNRKPLEKQPEVLLPWLKERRLHQQTINMYADMLRRFSEFQNDAVKHGDSFAVQELEFQIYVTGALMRLLLQVAPNT